jgi:hypothetical protein
MRSKPDQFRASLSGFDSQQGFDQRFLLVPWAMWYG